MVVAECAVVSALVILTWQLVTTHHAASDISVVLPPATAAPQPAAAGAVPPAAPAPTVHRQVPGLNVDASFWGFRLADLNKDEAALEAIEWQLTHVALDSARGYLETVVLPAIRQAEGR